MSVVEFIIECNNRESAPFEPPSRTIRMERKNHKKEEYQWREGGEVGPIDVTAD